MWIETRNGKLRAYEKYTDRLTGKRRRVSCYIPNRTRGTLAAAQRELDEMISKKTGRTTTDGPLTLKDLVDRYVAWQRENNRPQTALNADMHSRTLMKCIGEDSLVSEFDDIIISDRLSCEDPTTFNERLRRFKSLMRWAEQHRVVDDISYIGKIHRRKAPSTREKDSEKFLEHDEMKRLLDGMEKCPRWKYLTRFLILSGLRVGESLALFDRDVGDKTISVTKTMNPNGGGIQYNTKTDSSTREVAIQDELRELIDEWRKFRDDENEKLGVVSEFFFNQCNGESMSYQSYCKYLRERSEDILGRRITPHALRHTHTALMAEAGIDLAPISRRLGHKNSKVTEDVYMHVTERLKEKDAELIKGVRLMD